MLFNSFAFAVFLPTVFILYWFVFKKKLVFQNILLLAASYFFYGWWDWRFLSLLFISSLVDYIIGLRLVAIEESKKKNLMLGISLLFNLGFLGIFKYYNFFADSLILLLSSLNIPLDFSTLNIILPVGISFYTFQNLSYTIDIHNGKFKPTKDVFAFFAFASFFPQLVAGPIERASALLPQFCRDRSFDYEKARDGLQQILWGFVKKIFVADVLAPQVNEIFKNFNKLDGSTLLLGAIFFSFQIYCDFSGYSDIAIGTAKLFGFDLMTNFKAPYFSKSVSEFWRRWHISLSTWFRDYLFIPLGGSRESKIKTIRNIIITFVVSGLWHGANWTFVIWGFINGLYMVPAIIFIKRHEIQQEEKVKKLNPVFGNLLQIITTYSLITLTWIFFRSEDILDALKYLSRMFSRSIFVNPGSQYLIYFVPILLVLILEAISKDDFFPWRKMNSLPKTIRWILYLLFALLVIGAYQEENTFIYFQF